MSTFTSRADTVPAELHLPDAPGQWQADPQRTSVDMGGNGIRDVTLAYQRGSDEVLLVKHRLRPDCYIATAHLIDDDYVVTSVFEEWSEARDWVLDFLHEDVYGDI